MTRRRRRAAARRRQIIEAELTQEQTKAIAQALEDGIDVGIKIKI